MRKMIMALVVFLLMATGALAGGGERGDWEVGLYAGYGWLDDYSFLQPKDDVLYGVRGGYFFSPSWSLEMSLQRLSTETDGTFVGVDTDLDACRLNLLYNFAPGSRVRPFITAGVGCEMIDASELGESAGLGLNAGLGLRMFMSDHVGIRFDARYVSADVGRQVDARQNNVEGTLGLMFAFGGGPPRDSDYDGVRDGDDDCPNTPRGATVDARGCPKDSDGDGVYDGIDQCPNTPRGVKVDARGCPIDSDGDGVPDGTDQCPDTPRGATVDARGCPKDSDGDGVYDGIDQCPDTPRGATVDARGCPKDSDGDGVYDGIDQCPDTPRNAKVDARGCPITPPIVQRLLEKEPVVLEGVEFDVNKDSLRPESHRILDEVADSLKDWPDLRVEVQGHTDSTGSSAHNQALSNRRAASVKAYLVSRGISASRLEAKGFGEDRPIASNETTEGKQKNRRVELNKID